MRRITAKFTIATLLFAITAIAVSANLSVSPRTTQAHSPDEAYMIATKSAGECDEPMAAGCRESAFYSGDPDPIPFTEIPDAPTAGGTGSVTLTALNSPNDDGAPASTRQVPAWVLQTHPRASGPGKAIVAATALLRIERELTTALLTMPFMAEYSPGDAQAMQTIYLIANKNLDHAKSIVNHKRFADRGGINDREARLIATLGIPYFLDPEGTIKQLDTSNKIHFKGRLKQGQHNNKILFNVFSWSEDAPVDDTLKYAAAAVKESEKLMDQALHVDYVGILLQDHSAAYGTNNQASIRVDASLRDENLANIVAHEVSHYWWGPQVHREWIAEGFANYFGSWFVKQQFPGQKVKVVTWPCPYYRTIEHLEAVDPPSLPGLKNGFLCNYSLGDRLFVGLKKSMNGENFTEALRKFYSDVTASNSSSNHGAMMMDAFCPKCRNSPHNLSRPGAVMFRIYGQRLLNNPEQATGTIPELGGRPSSIYMDDYRSNLTQVGFPTVPATAPDQRRWLRMFFRNIPDDAPSKVTIIVTQHFEDHRHYREQTQEVKVNRVPNTKNAVVFAYLGNPDRRPVGHHWAFVHNKEGERIGGLDYQVVH